MGNPEKLYIDTIRKKAGRAINRYSMIGAGDRVLVALSGGKDSLVLLDILTERLKYLPVTYEIIAAHVIVDSLPQKIDAVILSDFCAARGVQLHIRTIHVDFDIAQGKSVCFFCSWHRRKMLFNMMNEFHCSRLSFGHHMDDIIETLLMNMAIHGKFSTMPPKLSLFKGDFDIIRPLCLLTEHEVSRYARLRGCTAQESPCPHGQNSKRAVTKKLIQSMEELSPRARGNLYRSMFHIDNEYLAHNFHHDAGVE